MWYLLILSLSLTLYVDSVSSATESSRHKRDDESEPWKKPVLPNHIEPTHYDVYIEPNCSGNATGFSGNVTIDIDVFKTTNTFIVHSKQLRVAIKSATVHDKDGNEKYVGYYFNNEENDYFVIQTEEYLDPGRAKLMYWFEGNMSLVTGSDFNRPGLYKIRFIKNDGQESWLILNDNGKSNARHIFPNFDEPRFKATFRIQIRHAPGLVALSNMGLDEGYPKDFVNDTKISIFKLSPLMSSHQVSFAITDLHVQRYETNETQFGVWGRLGPLNNANYTLTVTPTIRNYLRTELDMPFTIDKLDMLAVPGQAFANHRNNWGLNIFEESDILFDETVVGDSARYVALQSIARAQAHNYFGNLVTCRYWSHAWLSEGLATFYEIRAMTEVDPTFRHKDIFFGEQIEIAMYLDARNEVEPLILASDSAEVSFLDVETIHGEKGAAILRMVENFVGADPFRLGIRQYLSEHANGTVVTDDLWDALKEDEDEPLAITKIMMDWVEKRGFPLVKIELLHGNRINATQKQFLSDRTSPPSHTPKWYVPLTYRIKGGDVHTAWIKDGHVSAVFKIPELKEDDWIEFNVDRIGYYRVNYDKDLWDRLAKQLNEDHTVFTEISRSKLLSDAFALVDAEELGYDVFLDLTRYASKEMGTTPWIHIQRGLTEINIIYNTTILRPYQNYVLNLTRNLMDKLQVKDEGTRMERQLRPLIMQMSCAAGYEGCVNNTVRMFKAWIKDEKTNAVPKNLQRDVYCIGLAHSEEISEWITVFERYILMRAGEEAEELLIGLCCTRNTELLEALLDRAVWPTRPNIFESINTINFIVSTPYSEHYAWNWLKRKYSAIVAHRGGSYAVNVLEQVVATFNTQMLYEEVLDFYGRHPDIVADVKDLIKKKIDSNIHWMDRNLDVITTWLETNA